MKPRSKRKLRRPPQKKPQAVLRRHGPAVKKSRAIAGRRIDLSISALETVCLVGPPRQRREPRVTYCAQVSGVAAPVVVASVAKPRVQWAANALLLNGIRIEPGDSDHVIDADGIRHDLGTHGAGCVWEFSEIGKLIGVLP
ncbi:MAG: hypothetical protein ACT4O6_18950 [Reyranella sp.]